MGMPKDWYISTVRASSYHVISYRGCNKCLNCGRFIKYNMGMKYHNPLPCESCGDQNPRRLPMRNRNE